MKLSRLHDPSVEISDPFNDDQLARKDLANRLVELLKNARGPLTIALSGSFGTGKSYFLTRLHQVLRNEKFAAVLINAWETDYATEPLAPLVTTLEKEFASANTDTEQLVSNIKSKAASLAALAVPIGLKLLSAGILKTDDFSEETIADAVENVARQQFDRFSASHVTIQNLRSDLANFAAKVRESHTGPLVIIVDELDRCRPSYAVEFLEVVKHLFHIPGIIFLLGIDRRQLAVSASAVFGQALDGDAYLRRFIDLDWSLPQPNVADYMTYCGPEIVRQTLGTSIPRTAAEGMLQGVGQLCAGAGFSLRKAHQIVTRLITTAIVSEHHLISEVVALLTFLREYDLALYESFRNGSTSAWSLLEHIRAKLVPDFLFQWDGYGSPYFLFAFAYLGRRDPTTPFLERFEQTSNDTFKQLSKPIRDRLNRCSPDLRTLQECFRTVDFGAAVVSR